MKPYAIAPNKPAIVLMLRKNPAFALVVVMTLAIGIGGNTAVFGAFSNVFLGELPIRDADSPHAAAESIQATIAEQF